VPLSDRDYMKPNYPRQSSRGGGFADNSAMNPVMVIIIINVIVFFLAVFIPDIEIRMGLMPLNFSEQPWTILTSMFLHVSFLHIFGNMLVLFFFGRIIFKMVGGWRFLVIYFVGGLAGNVLYLLIGPQFSIAYGASGAVYAIAGTLVVLMPNMRVALWGIIPMPLWVFALIFMGLLSIPPFAGPNIAWQAHMGGLAVGLIAGFIYRRQMRRVIYR
jgi:membrane associated rhomboid family serine protease